MHAKRKIYLKMKTLLEAREIQFARFEPRAFAAKETIAVPDAVGRVLAEAVRARVSSPNFHAAAMDGIAVKAQCTFGAGETSPKVLTIGRDAFYVNTGHAMPENTDAVIMIEHINALDNDRVVIEAPAFPWQYVRKLGEDIVATEQLFPRNHVVTPYCIGALLTGGVFTVAVRSKPRVLIIPTGSELVDWREARPEDLKPGQVFETNAYVLGKLVEACGGHFVHHHRLKDDEAEIREAIQTAAGSDFDIILTVGGSSAGSEDYTQPVIESLGEILVHGVTIMPGKPLIIGDVNGKPVFGMPGYPVSAIMAFEQFVGPLICRMLRKSDLKPATVQVAPTRNIPSKLGIEEFVRVKLGQVGDRIVATQLPRGAGCITSITEADGIIRIPNHVEGLKAHTPVRAELIRSIAEVKNTIVVAGSHDNTLDVLADQIKAVKGNLTLSSSHVGSMGGLMALKKGVCHMAGSHILDPADGSYNVSYVKRLLPNTDVRVVNLVLRDQGLLVFPGNPKKIKGIEDLVRDDVRYINRQGGSGTRILLDYRLQQMDIDPGRIKGYETEEYTHMAVAVAVLSRSVDVGLGIYAAAKALNLDFIPMVTEQYDLVIPQNFFESDNIQVVLDIIKSRQFKARVEKLGGYSTKMTGKIIF